MANQSGNQTLMDVSHVTTYLGSILRFININVELSMYMMCVLLHIYI